MDVLRQDKIWIAKDGRKLRLEEMEPGHRSNLLAYLRRRAPGLHLQNALRLSTMPMPDIESMAYDTLSDGINRELDMPPERWLEEQPLVIRLAELAAESEDRP